MSETPMNAGEEVATPADEDGVSASEDESSQGYSRRGFLSTATAAGATTGLAGCLGYDGDGGGDEADGENGDTDDDSDPGETDGTGEQDFLWWTMEGYVPEIESTIRDVAAAFEDHTDQEVNLTTQVVTWDSVFEEWSATVQGHSAPNVSQMGNEHAAEFGDRGVNREITDVFEDFDDWYPMMDPWASWDGEKWGVPWYLETRPIYSNMETLEQAGHSSPPETWQELVETAIDIADQTDASGYADGGARDFLTGHHVFTYTAQAGGQFFDYDEEEEEWRVEIDSPLSLFGHLWYASFQEAWDAAPGGWGGVESSDIIELYLRERTGIARQTGGLAAEMFDSDAQDLIESTEISIIPTGPDGTNWSFYGGGCLSPFTSEVTQYDVSEGLEDEFMSYMIQQDQMEEQFLAGAPRMLPTREAQEEIQPFSDNPTDMPSEWLDTFTDQAAESIRGGIYGGERNAPFLGALEGTTAAYSEAISGILGAGDEPKEAIQTLANTVREEISNHEDYELPQKDELPSLDNIPEDAPNEVQHWIEGDDVPQIWNPDA